MDGFALPVKKLQGTDPVETLDLSRNNLGDASAVAIASLIGINGVLTSIDLRGNQLCGIWTDRFGSQQGAYTAEGIIAIANALRVNGTLTVTNLQRNHLDEESAHMLAEVAKQKGISLCSIRRDQTTAYFSDQYLTPPDAILLASDLSQAVVTGALTSVELRGNKLRDKGWGAIFAAICGNKDSKSMSLDASSENIGPAGVKLIAEALRTSVTGALTVINLLGNQLDADSAKMLAEVAKQKGISLCGIQRDQATAHFSLKSLQPPDAILLASDLSQAVVTGGLTSLDLSKTQLCGVTSWGSGTYTTEGITAIADALRVNGSLTSLDLSSNQLCGVWTDDDGDEHDNYTAEGITAIADSLRVNGALTALNLSSNRLKDEGVSAVCKAIQSNKETKLALLNMGANSIGPIGAKSVAAMVAVTGVLIECDLSNNDMGEEGKASIRFAAQGKAGFNLHL